MKVTKEQKILFSILGIGMLALIYDNVSGNTPAVANASEESTTSTPQPAGSGSSVDSVNIAKTGNVISLASRLESLRPALVANMHADPFAKPNIEQNVPVEVDQFRKKYRLTGVLVGAGNGRAMIDGMPVRIGQKLDGMTLISVDRQSAVFQSGDKRVILTLND